ncbi:(2Fe-2S) ferredoxin domain-containing protein [Chitinophaga rhizophila]|uniref:(2Fe-2S) ferredoxin domain-containing protein n=1 Tax=Chitinophaga rhizophila TaxID=2866212 RepID=A0ABS7GK96_9BACT|nr:(2Fe-2S) ferredoxin domain-containing protein [Chitinophaga rhizophila]MBW8687077.1 (2Fe-2S) ferredoxin domain-containing protein [Chitinophaga rhizophila]
MYSFKAITGMAIKDLTKVQKILFMCNGGTCSNKGADDTTNQIRAHLTENDLNAEIHTVRTKCLGQCTWGPMIFMHPEGVWYKGVTPEATRDIVTQHLIRNELVTGHVHFPDAAQIEAKPLVRIPQPNE